jgi:hypothetical protein
MNTKHFAIHDSTQSQKVKHLTTISPHTRTPIFPHTFIVETVDLGDLTRFVVPSDKGDAIWITNFQGEEEEKGFNRVETSVYVVTYLWGVDLIKLVVLLP